MLLETPLKQITANDILNLVSNEILEGKHLDYKKCLYPNTPYGKDEFRKDVTVDEIVNQIMLDRENKGSSVAYLRKPFHPFILVASSCLTFSNLQAE